MNKKVQVLIDAICMIPRQFFTNTTNVDNSSSAYEQFVSQLMVRYRRITGVQCRRESILPNSEAIKKFADYEDNKEIVRKITSGLSSSCIINPSLFIESEEYSSDSQISIVEIRTDEKIKLGVFYWDFFKLHYHADNHKCTYGAYFIINQDVPSIQKKINAYFARGLYCSKRAENIVFLVKKDYKSDIVVLDYRGCVI